MTSLRASSVEALRKLMGHPRLLPLTALLLRARTVRSSTVFLTRESLRRKGISVYRLRESGLRVAIRHGTGDVVTLGEVFHEHDYRPPPVVSEALGQVRSIVDLGANVGLFGVFAAGCWPEAEILAFEPDPDNVTVHERAISENGLRARWSLVPAAAGTSDGQATFAVGQIALSHVVDGEPDGPTCEVPVRDVLPRLARADLLKMDIEGGEWAILGDPRFREAPPRVLVIEYHPRMCPDPDPRAAVESRLRAAGLRLHAIWHRADGHGMLWAWRD
jgi:FkbM family methyltransferase